MIPPKGAPYGSPIYEEIEDVERVISGCPKHWGYYLPTGQMLRFFQNTYDMTRDGNWIVTEIHEDFNLSDPDCIEKIAAWKESLK